MRLTSNGGNLMVNQKGKNRFFPIKIWFDDRAIANIIGLKDCERVYDVSYHTRNKAFIVHRPGLPDMIFKQHPCGLHYFDPDDPSFLDTDASFVMNTVEENMIGFTKREIKQARAARELYPKLGYPSWKDFRWAVQTNQIRNCPVTVQDVDNAMKIDW